LKMTGEVRNWKGMGLQGEYDVGDRGIDMGGAGGGMASRAGLVGQGRRVGDGGSLPRRKPGLSAVAGGKGGPGESAGDGRRDGSPPGKEPVDQRAVGLVLEHGVTPCPRRMNDLLARDRCMGYQACGCRCPAGEVVAEAARQHEAWETKEDERLVEARKMYQARRYPPWKLKCQYRGCLREFEKERQWSKKNSYCCKEHEQAEWNARKRDQRARVRAVLGAAAGEGR
jgi:hypothetical protein